MDDEMNMPKVTDVGVLNQDGVAIGFVRCQGLEPAEGLIFQWTPGETGAKNLHFEIGDQSNGDYGLVDSIGFEGAVLSVHLKSQSQLHLDCSEVDRQAVLGLVSQVQAVLNG